MLCTKVLYIGQMTEVSTSTVIIDISVEGSTLRIS